MADPTTVYGTVYKNGTATLMARIVEDDATRIVQADVSTIVYSVYLLDSSDPDTQTVQTGHDGVSLTVANVIFDTLQTDDRWTEDSTGYNFRHTVDVSSNAAFGTAGRTYRVEYTLTPDSGQDILLRFDLYAT